MKKWRCVVCGYIHEGDAPPDVCPVCGAGPEMFEQVEAAAPGKAGLGTDTGKSAEVVIGQKDPKAMQSALFKISYGLFIVASVKGDKINGQCANTVFQITSEPMRVALGINKSNLTHEYIQECGAVGITILGEDGHDLVRQFGYSSGRDKDKFAGVAYVRGTTGVPIINNGVAFLEGKINFEKSVDMGTHTLFIADIIDGGVIADREPMTYTYFRRTK